MEDIETKIINLYNTLQSEDFESDPLKQNDKAKLLVEGAILFKEWKKGSELYEIEKYIKSELERYMTQVKDPYVRRTILLGLSKS